MSPVASVREGGGPARAIVIVVNLLACPPARRA